MTPERAQQIIREQSEKMREAVAAGCREFVRDNPIYEGASPAQRLHLLMAWALGFTAGGEYEQSCQKEAARCRGRTGGMA